MAAITPPYDHVHLPSPARKKTIHYPTGDSKPMAEDTLHRDLMFYAIAALQSHFADHADIYISGNDFLYYEEGNAQARVSPDCYVVKGVQKHYRPFYKIWEENNTAPAVVFEFTSKKTRREDTATKQPLYEQRLQVEEYIQFDPTGDYLKPRLQGERLQAGKYERMTLHEDRLYSAQLGLELVMVGEAMRFFDPQKGEWLRTYTEAEAQRLAAMRRAEAATRRAEAEAQRANNAEAENARLRTELEALRRQK